MKYDVWPLFIVFIFLIFILFFLVIYKKHSKTTQENFTTPTALNVPNGGPNGLDGKPFFVGNKIPELKDEPIVATSAKVEFRKPQLLYDGIWGEKCELDGKGFGTCDWKFTYSNYPLDKPGFSYGADSFFHMPLKRMRIGEEIVSPPDCPADAP